MGQVRNLGLPFLQSFSKENYQAATQNSDVVQDARGVVYFANNEGLLSFDGKTWQIYPLPNHTIVRSLAVAENGYIFAGGQNEFGRFRPNSNGDWAFESLKELIPEAGRSFEDVWDIEVVDEYAYFRASGKLYQFYQDSIQVLAQNNLNFMGQTGGKIYAQDDSGLLYVLEQNKLKAISSTSTLKGKIVTGIVSIAPNKLLIGTSEHGFYQLAGDQLMNYQSSIDGFFIQNRINNLEQLSGNQIAVATDFAGILIMDMEGNAIYHIDKNAGLLTNRVLSLYQDLEQNLWMGLSNGIGYLEISSPFTNILPDGELEGVGYDVRVHDEQIYFATANGLYAAPWVDNYSPLVENKFQLIENSKGQSWGLNIVNDQLFLAHNKGAYLVDNQRARPIYDGRGIWNFQQLDGQPNLILAGSYKDLIIFDQENGDWKMSHTMNASDESCRFVEQDIDGNIWVAHPYKGIFKITPTTDLHSAKIISYDESHGLPSRLYNHLFKVKNEIIFCAERGVYEYNASEDRFVPSVSFNEMFGAETKVRRLQETNEGDIWFITEKELGKIEISEKGLERQVQKSVFANLNKKLNPGFEKIYAYDNNNVFITYDQGFLHYHPHEENNDSTKVQVVFTKINFSDMPDSILFAGVAEEDNHITNSLTETAHFGPHQNALQFAFTATNFSQHDKMSYRYYLKGVDEDWSNWREETDKEYTNLFPGVYTFHVQVLHPDKGESKVLTYSFEIHPPWYQTNTAKAIYGLLLLSMSGWIIYTYFSKYQNLKAENQQVVQESQAEIHKLKEEKTEAELQFKKRELISTTMHLVQKNERLEDIKKKLTDIVKKTKEPEISKALRALLRQFNQDEVLDEGWEKFMLHFNQLHGNYFDRLKEQYPKLTPKDLKLCAYLRMNLSTKEIATLMNVTVRGVEASRYRLRRKLELSSEENLTSHLMHY